jgi:hypothetical protein
MRNLGMVALACAIVGGIMVVLGILRAAPGTYLLGAIIAGIPLAFLVYIWWAEVLPQGSVVDRISEAQRRRREARHEQWTIYPDASAPPNAPGTRGPFQAVPLYSPGNCPACGGTLFYGRLNCPHCSAPVFRDGEGARPPEL